MKSCTIGLAAMLLGLATVPGCFKTAEKKSTRHPVGSGDAATETDDDPLPDTEEDPDDLAKTNTKRDETSDKPAVVDENTNGSGGARTGELTSQSGLRYIISVPDDNQAQVKSHGVLVLLHGSSASNYREFVGQMRQVGQSQGLILVSVLAPMVAAGTKAARSAPPISSTS